jgi:UDP-perosamine 4-acetyltransferase
MKKKLVVFGGGPHCKVVLDLLLHSGEYEVVGVVDKDGNAPFGVPVIEMEDDMEAVKAMGVDCVFVAVGSNRVRKKTGNRGCRGGS